MEQRAKSASVNPLKPSGDGNVWRPEFNFLKKGVNTRPTYQLKYIPLDWSRFISNRPICFAIKVIILDVWCFPTKPNQRFQSLTWHGYYYIISQRSDSLDILQWEKKTCIFADNGLTLLQPAKKAIRSMLTSSIQIPAYCYQVILFRQSEPTCFSLYRNKYSIFQVASIRTYFRQYFVLL